MGTDGAWRWTEGWALVTGASAGLGETFARTIARRGMNVVLVARREDRLRALAGELARDHGVETAVIPADLGKPGAAGVLWAEAVDGRDVRLVVNNAGFGLKGPFTDLPAARQAEMLRVNCVALLELCHLAADTLRSRGVGGGIVNVASVAAYQPIPTLATYAASKAFVLALSEALQEELRGDRIRVVTLNPGPVRTEFQSVAGTQVTPGTLGVRTPEAVVDAAIAALEAGGGTVTPGFVNRVGTTLARMGPRGLVLRAAKTVMQKMR